MLKKAEESNQLESKGFYPTVLVQDFPLQGKRLLLNIRRRRWIDMQTGEYVSRTIHITADGARLTQEHAPFFKKITPTTMLSVAIQQVTYIGLTSIGLSGNTRAI